MKSAAHALLALIGSVERGLAVFLFAAMTIIMIADVGLREIRGIGVHGASQIAVYCFVALSMIGIGMASATASHLRPRFVDRLFPPKYEDFLRRLQEVVMTGFCLVVASVATNIVAETHALGEVSPALRIEIWWIQAVIPLVFYVATIRHALYAIFLDLKPVPASALEGETA